MWCNQGETNHHDREGHWGHRGYIWGDWGTYHGTVGTVVGYWDASKGHYFGISLYEQ